jgi:hypothetical protein
MSQQLQDSNTSTKVSEDSMIVDGRGAAEFKSDTFSKYKKTDVKKQLLSAMVKGKIEPACYWSAELVCAGEFIDIWEMVLLFLGKYVSTANIRLTVYLEYRYSIFRNICAQQSELTAELNLRNHKEIRKLFAELMYVCCTSRQKNSVEVIKINRVEEFDISQLSDRLKATSTDFVRGIIKTKDPKELTIPLNELGFQLSERNTSAACYWVEWVIEFDHFCRNVKKKPCVCEKRPEYPCESKLSRDAIWLVWDLLFKYAEQGTTSNVRAPIIKATMDALLQLFAIRYTSAACRKRRYLMYFAVSLLTEPMDDACAQQPLVQNPTMLEMIVDRIDTTVYKQIKKNEERLKMDYLYHNLQYERLMMDESLGF